MRTLLIPSCLLLLATAPDAQEVTLRGKVENGGPTGFLIDCSSTVLTSSGVNLNALLDQQVLVSGTWNGSTTSPVVNVTSAAIVAEIFEIPGNPQIGKTLRFGAIGTPGSLVVFFAAPASGFLPLGSSGTFLLDPATAFRAASGLIGGLGNIELAMPLPNSPALIGLTAFGQAAIVAPGFTSLTISNPDCKTIQS